MRNTKNIKKFYILIVQNLIVFFSLPLKVKLFFSYILHSINNLWIFLTLWSLRSFLLRKLRSMLLNIISDINDKILYHFSSAPNLKNRDFLPVFISLSSFDIPSLILLERRNTFDLQISTIQMDLYGYKYPISKSKGWN